MSLSLSLKINIIEMISKENEREIYKFFSTVIDGTYSKNYLVYKSNKSVESKRKTH